MNTLLRTALVCFIGVLTASACNAGVASLADKWVQGELNICFFGGSPKLRATVAETASEWAPGTSLVLNFGRAPEYRSCSRGSSDIRIGFDKTGSWAYPGRLALNVDPTLPTMNLVLDDAVPDVATARRTILHEFGHALGLLHQEQDPVANCQSEIDMNVAARRLIFSVSSMEDIRPVVANDGKYLISPFDRTSVMRFAGNETLFRRGKDSPCYGEPVEALSPDDRNLIARLYPPRPPDVSAATYRTRVSIVLDGALAQETFQHVVIALRKSNLVGVRQYVDAFGDGIGNILQKAGLSPTAAVTKEYERFLCEENPHICVRSTAGVMWQNRPAQVNTAEEKFDCGSLRVSKWILCLPNIRYETQRVFVDAKYDPSVNQSLADYVVNRLKGCASWDEACERVVEVSNPKLDPSLLRGSRQRAAPAINLTLPATIYRIPVEYGSEGERRRISEVVEDVRERRARELRVGKDQIAVRLVEPVGNPQPKAISAILSEPVRSYADVLRAMKYPFTDTENEKQLRTFHRVDVAIWDTRVDVTHCEFQRAPARLVEITVYPDPPSDPAPEKSPNCGEVRKPPVRAVERWDHGTHVAGIIAAQVNGKGIAGVNPNVNIWSWEVINGNQFNVEDDPFIRVISDFRLNPLVVNISQEIPLKSSDNTSALESFLFGAGQRIGIHNVRLVVAAAGTGTDGNGGEEGKRVERSQQCKYFPACWSNSDMGMQPRNVVSVVALDGEGKAVLKDGQKAASNYGDAFDVSAIGEATSTMHGDWVGSLRGSSFATPYVTGLASLLIGKAKSLNLEVKTSSLKERILATADSDTDDLRAASRFGRINFSRALDFTNDMVVLKPSVTGCTDCTIRGRTTNKTSWIPVSHTPYSGGPRTPRPLFVQNIRRMMSDTNGSFTVYYTDGGRLERLNSVVLDVPSTPVVVNGRSIPASSIEEYVSCSFSASCESQ